MGTRPLLVSLWAFLCACKQTPELVDDSGVCLDEQEVEGTYVATAYEGVCFQSSAVKEACKAWYPPFGKWWGNHSCPSFSETASYAFNVGQGELGAVLIVERCSADGLPYDVIWFNPADDSTFSRSVFSDSGELVWYSFSHGSIADDTPYCCSGIPAAALVWGKALPLDCGNATLYSIEDFPPFPSTPTQNNPTSQTSLETADTGAP